jgi:hypothetical protein
MTIKEELNRLKETDVYSMLLFILYKMKDIEEYSVLSELAYILDKQNLLNLCEYFGGLTIQIPTIDELESLLNSLLLYQYIEIDKLSYDEAIAKIGFDSFDLRKIKKDYGKISELLETYSFLRG